MHAAQGSENRANDEGEKSREAFESAEGGVDTATMEAAHAHEEVDIAKNRDTAAQGLATDAVDRANTAGSVTAKADSRAEEAAADMITNSHNYGLAEDHRRATEGS